MKNGSKKRRKDGGGGEGGGKRRMTAGKNCFHLIKSRQIRQPIANQSIPHRMQLKKKQNSKVPNVARCIKDT